ncbi:MAG TPA: hypothetical protein VIJ85_10055 [Rhizomicrobium sp.]
MPEFYEGGFCKYQPRAQPYLGAIARGFKESANARAFLLGDTKFFETYARAVPLWQEQWQMRDPTNSMLCPFWSNYWYNPCKSCDCRIDKSVSMEIDAMFFLRNSAARTLAIHIEMKRDAELLSIGQAEAYRPRAKCYRDQRRVRKGLPPHDDFLTVLFCGRGADVSFVEQHFDRVIFHERARDVFPGYPVA